MSHSCSHHGHHHPAPTSFHGAFAIGVILNAGFIAAELLAGWRAHSLALVADATHNLGDVLGLVAAWFGYYLSSRAPTDRFTAGFGRMSIYTTILNGLLLIFSGFWIILEAIERLQAPQATAPGIVAVVAAIGIIINLGTAFVLMRGQHDINIKGAMLHMLGDAAISAAVVLAAGLIALTGWLWIDPVISLVLALVILWTSWPLLSEGLRLAMDGVPAAINKSEILDFIQHQKGVTAVPELRIWALSTTKTALAAHIVLDSETTADQALSSLRHVLQHRFGLGSITLQVEHDHSHCNH